MKTIVDFNLSGKRVIIRCDLNVPIKDGVITDDTRIKESIETIKIALDADAKVIVLSHLGRVKSDEDKASNTLLPVSQRLSELLRVPVKFVPFTRGREVEAAVVGMNNGEIIMLENTRFEDIEGNKESGNDPELGQYWASLGDLFINDAFGTSHRAHASNVGIASYLPHGIGLLVKKELDVLEGAMQNPKHPFIVILGGAKVEDKLGVISNLVTKADKLFIGGGMCYTFLKALGYNIGGSIVDDTKLELCKNIYEQYKDKIILPVDVVVGSPMTPMSTARLANISDIRQNDIGMDMGVQTMDSLRNTLIGAGMVIWNRPIGVFEIDKFNVGTRKLLDYLSSINAKVILGGGDTAAAAARFGYKDKFYHISTGGGATLELMEGKALPGIEAIKK
jgi:phosphoglycerate kinase